MKNKYIKTLLLFSFCLCGLFQAALSFPYFFSQAAFLLPPLKILTFTVKCSIRKILKFVSSANAAALCREEKKISQGSYGKLTCCSIISDVNVVFSACIIHQTASCRHFIHFPPTPVRAIRVHAILRYS